MIDPQETTIPSNDNSENDKNHCGMRRNMMDKSPTAPMHFCDAASSMASSFRSQVSSDADRIDDDDDFVSLERSNKEDGISQQLISDAMRVLEFTEGVEDEEADTDFEATNCNRAEFRNRNLQEESALMDARRCVLQGFPPNFRMPKTKEEAEERRKKEKYLSNMDGLYQKLYEARNSSGGIEIFDDDASTESDLEE